MSCACKRLGRRLEQPVHTFHTQVLELAPRYIISKFRRPKKELTPQQQVMLVQTQEWFDQLRIVRRESMPIDSTSQVDNQQRRAKGE